MSIFEAVLVCLGVGLVLGFAPGSINQNRSLKMALQIGVMFGTICGGFALWAGAGWLLGGLLFASSCTGSLIACYTPNSNWLKRYFDLNRR